MYLNFTCILRNQVKNKIKLQSRYFSTNFTDKKLDLIRHLRKLTNEGVASCKEALVKNNWDINRAASHILGDQEKRTINFEENKLIHGKTGLASNLGGSKSVVLRLVSDCDFVASTKIFEDLCRAVTSSLLEYLEQKPAEYFANRPHIFAFDSGELDSVSNRSSKEDNLKNLIARSASQFGKPVVAEKIYVVQNKGTDVIGSYTHRAVGEAASEPSVGRRAGVVSLSCSSERELDKLQLKKVADFLAFQVVAFPYFDSMENMLSQNFLKYENFNEIVRELSLPLNVKWNPINENTTIRESLNLIKELKIAEISVNGFVYLNSGKESLAIIK